MSEFTGVVITSIPALRFAIERFCPDCELLPGAHYRTWKDNHGGNFVGDYAGPPGVDATQLGDNATYIIRATDACLKTRFNGVARDHIRAPYEIGVVARENGQFSLMLDFWNQGNGLLNLPGLGAYNHETSTAFDALYMHYRMGEQRAVAMENGDSIEFQQHQDGHWTAIVQPAQLAGA